MKDKMAANVRQTCNKHNDENKKGRYFATKVPASIHRVTCSAQWFLRIGLFIANKAIAIIIAKAKRVQICICKRTMCHQSRSPFGCCNQHTPSSRHCQAFFRTNHPNHFVSLSADHAPLGPLFLADTGRFNSFNIDWLAGEHRPNTSRKNTICFSNLLYKNIVEMGYIPIKQP